MRVAGERNSAAGLPVILSGAAGLPVILSGAAGLPVNLSGAAGLPVNLSDSAAGLPVILSGAAALPVILSGAAALPVILSGAAALSVLDDYEERQSCELSLATSHPCISCTRSTKMTTRKQFLFYLNKTPFCLSDSRFILLTL
ncbi:hypothetical protein RRG08_046661 [Elysia crispata]|uniref:Uncharacterized protein n=1 Tax=Elysia crispata TaxID=231223 RepID=A0AAE1BC14_9GAST|nr:hypothetical protein RRG08_046661 [Elysia crispata]